MTENEDFTQIQFSLRKNIVITRAKDDGDGFEKLSLDENKVVTGKCVCVMLCGV